ncbi:hypothetical protein AV521_09405 [Streptomyces sp. IMTB 2501]|uniref:DUF6153 family protein n=1 Tax=Streptomyces sp. IMTB 2501 TaxID=1776340 RepID=UPI00096DF8F8|nr:DUF6153 family protein [Streptomyces sp. IMTB 2501]OLZ72126.1 hypothetical protein AV521_09405 [Streptomyces sp. IMTB 2501]
MHSAGPRTSCPPQRRRHGLLVLALLVGLLGMHALGPVGGVGHAEYGGPGRHMVAAGTVVAVAQDDCADADGHCGGGRLHHADPACASGAVNGGPELPALVPDHTVVAAPDGCPGSRAATGPGGARAPPSLAELQLLRI